MTATLAEPAPTTEEKPKITRDIRQSGIISRDRLQECHCLVVGVGAIGRQVALLLACTGVHTIECWDDDEVNVENLAVQGFWEKDLKEKKALVVCNLIDEINSEVQAIPCIRKFSTTSEIDVSNEMNLCVFCCVDKMSARETVWNINRNRANFFVDGRMNAEVMRVLASTNPRDDEYYKTTLFADEEAQQGTCTARSILYSAQMAASIMVCQFTRWLRSIQVTQDQSFNMLTDELTVIK